MDLPFAVETSAGCDHYQQKGIMFNRTLSSVHTVNKRSNQGLKGLWNRTLDRWGGLRSDKSLLRRNDLHPKTHNAMILSIELSWSINMCVAGICCLVAENTTTAWLLEKMAGCDEMKQKSVHPRSCISPAVYWLLSKNEMLIDNNLLLYNNCCGLLSPTLD